MTWKNEKLAAYNGYVFVWQSRNPTLRYGADMKPCYTKGTPGEFDVVTLQTPK